MIAPSVILFFFFIIHVHTVASSYPCLLAVVCRSVCTKLKTICAERNISFIFELCLSAEHNLLWTASMWYGCTRINCKYFTWSVKQTHRSSHSLLCKNKKASLYECRDLFNRKQQYIHSVELLYNTTQWAV